MKSFISTIIYLSLPLILCAEGKSILDIDQTALEQSERASLSALLSDQIPSDLYEEQGKLFFQRLHSIAHKLYPENEEASKALTKLKTGTNLKAANKSKISKEDFATEISSWASLLYDTNKTEDKKLAAHLAWIAKAVDEDNEEATGIYTKFRKNNTLDWSWIKPNSDKKEKTKAETNTEEKELNPDLIPFQKENSSIYGYSTELIERRFKAIPLKLYANIVPSEDEENPNQFKFTGKSTEGLNSALTKAKKIIQAKYPDIEAKDIHITFDEKNHEKVNSRPGLALYLLLRSLLDDFNIDKNVTVVGNIGEYNKVSSVGGINLKIISSIKNGYLYVIVPEENARQFEDMVIQTDKKFLWEIQVIAVEELEEAIGIIKEEKDEKLVVAFQKFELMQSILYKNRFDYTKKEIKALLEDILELCPGHLSARYLQRITKGNMPKKLSYEGSLLKIKEFTSSLDPDMNSDKPLRGSSDYTKIMAELRKISRSLDSRAKKVQIAWMNYCRYALGYKSYKMGKKSNTKAGLRMWEFKLKQKNALLKKSQKEKAVLLKVLGEKLSGDDYFKRLILEGY